MMEDYKRCLACNREMDLVKEIGVNVWSCECGKKVPISKQGSKGK